MILKIKLQGLGIVEFDASKEGFQSVRASNGQLVNGLKLSNGFRVRSAQELFYRPLEIHDDIIAEGEIIDMKLDI